MTDPLTKLAYQALQQGKSAFSLAHKTLSNRLLDAFAPPTALQKEQTQSVSPEILLEMQRRMASLQEEDWADAERGVYPSALLFDESWEDAFKFYPGVWLDLPKTWQRMQQGEFQDFATEIDTDGYPNYYLRNFHYQTDGYLGEESANLYDLQVDLLFNGATDAMRRRILAPLKRGLQHFEAERVAETASTAATNHPGTTTLAGPERSLKILDVACGTGRTLKMLRSALPKASLQGVDLSPAYLRKANELLMKQPGNLPQLTQANGEDLPYQDGYFHGITCVFLFHELPGPVRQKVINESFRLLKPGGTYVICDSIQAHENPELKPIMENFAVGFHEPFYRDYIADDMDARLSQARFENIQTSNHFMSKYWWGQKPV